MKLNTIITAASNNPLYRDFIPIFRTAWQKLFPGASIKIIIISDGPEYSGDQDIIHFSSIPGISSAFQAQCIRLLWPALLVNDEGHEKNGGVMITDIDMIPMNRSYYTGTIAHYGSEQFICMRDVIGHLGQYPVCYNIATPGTWKELFPVADMKDIESTLKAWYSRAEYDGEHGGSGWNFDQTMLFNVVNAWELQEKETGRSRLVLLKDQATGFKRLDRMHTREIITYLPKVLEMTRRGEFSDFHMPRPYNKYKSTLDQIANAL